MREKPEITLRGFGTLELTLPKDYYTDPEDKFILQSDLSTDKTDGYGQLGGVSYESTLTEGKTLYTFEKIVAGDYHFILRRMIPRENRTGDGLNFTETADTPFHIKPGETRQLTLSQE